MLNQEDKKGVKSRYKPLTSIWVSITSHLSGFQTCVIKDALLS